MFASGQARAALSLVNGGAPRLRVDYDFHEGAGFIAIRKEVAWTMPDSYRFGFRVDGEGPQNFLEFKLIDPAGVNVWRWESGNFRISRKGADVWINERKIPYAWGPAGGGAVREAGAVEWVIVAGPGGKGYVEIEGREFIDDTLRGPFETSSSSEIVEHTAWQALCDGGWKSGAGDNAPWWMVDFEREARFGGLVLKWGEDCAKVEFRVAITDDGVSWKPVHAAGCAPGRTNYVPVSGGVASGVRLDFSGPGVSLASVELMPDRFSTTPNEFLHNVAASHPRGSFPRYWSREQSYWSPVGSPWGRKRGLINEEGMVEVDEGAFSLEPFVEIDGVWKTWADVRTHLGLPPSGIPMPRVTWICDDWTLGISPWMEGRETKQALRVGYELRTNGKITRIAIAARPYQVNPPWQAFRNLGGRANVRRVSSHVAGLLVDQWRLISDKDPAEWGGITFDEGGVPAFLNGSHRTLSPQIEDATGLASGMLIYDVPKAARVFRIRITIPYTEDGTDGPHHLGRERVAEIWRSVLDRVHWDIPRDAHAAFRCWKTAAGHILIHRDGAAIQPGPRRYTRSWVRDCVIMGAALAKAGRVKPLREFLIWYAGFQRVDGFVPAVVDREGADWIIEHDSHGQFLWGLREALRFGAGVSMLENMWTHLKLAAETIIRLREERSGSEFLYGERAACFGLLPESASHEGYLAHHVHSYWDDFWGVRGLEAASEIALHLGNSSESTRWKNECAVFEKDVLDSMKRVIAERKLHYIPGSVEWADFDPTATANAIGLLGFGRALPQEPLREMLRTYMADFRKKHSGENKVWLNYTAYEIRIIGAMVRLGMRDEANELLDFFLADRRPLEWNQWPEISWRDPRWPGHLGDVPHTWIAAEYVLALAAMVADERESDDSMVLAAGLRIGWVAENFTVKGLNTRFGKLNFSLRVSAGELEFSIGGQLRMPPGGLFLRPPLPEDGVPAPENGAQFQVSGDELTILRIPCSGKIPIRRKSGSHPRGISVNA